MTNPLINDKRATLPLGVALLGHGTAGAWFHAPLVESVPTLALRVVATSRPESLAARRPPARGEPPLRVEPDPFRALADPAVDLVVIATPNDRHEALAEAALEAGKHVLVDKPLALSARAVERLGTLAERQGRTLEVFHNRRRDGDFLALKGVLASGQLGELRLLELRWDRFRPVVAGGWRYEAGPGAGVLWDLGTHLVDQALALLGPPDDFSADLACQRSGAAADDYFELTLRHGAARCVLSASCLVAAARPRFAAHGTAGSWVSHGLDPQEAALKAGGFPGDPRFRMGLAAGQAEWVDAQGVRHPQAVAPGDWRSFYVDLAAAIHRGGPPPVGWRAARDAVAIIEGALASAS